VIGGFFEAVAALEHRLIAFVYVCVKMVCSDGNSVVCHSVAVFLWDNSRQSDSTAKTCKTAVVLSAVLTNLVQ